MWRVVRKALGILRGIFSLVPYRQPLGMANPA